MGTLNMYGRDMAYIWFLYNIEERMDQNWYGCANGIFARMAGSC